MGIRETLNRNPAITTGVTVGIILLALGVILYQSLGGSSAGGNFSQGYFSTNLDGSDYFADDINKVAPFMKDGKEAYRVQVFSCDGGSTKFVGYLERFTKEGLARWEKHKQNPTATDPTAMDMLFETEMEVKSPKGDKWVRKIDPRAAEILDIRCPDGTIEKLEVVMP